MIVGEMSVGRLGRLVEGRVQARLHLGGGFAGMLLRLDALIGRRPRSGKASSVCWGRWLSLNEAKARPYAVGGASPRAGIAPSIPGLCGRPKRPEETAFRGLEADKAADEGREFERAQKPLAN
jgi:hypothetical protein